MNLSTVSLAKLILDVERIKELEEKSRKEPLDMNEGYELARLLNQYIVVSE